MENACTCLDSQGNPVGCDVPDTSLDVLVGDGSLSLPDMESTRADQSVPGTTRDAELGSPDISDAASRLENDATAPSVILDARTSEVSIDGNTSVTDMLLVEDVVSAQDETRRHSSC